MLLRKQVLDKIRSGEVDLAFRRWTRPTVKSGGTLRTGAGMLQLGSVESVRIDSISHADAARAGLELDELIDSLEVKSDGDIYRIELQGFVADPREALRASDKLSEEDLEDLDGRLDRLDRASRRGSWTRQFLALILDNPHVRAQDLADSLGLPKEDFKKDVRKLKSLGLTISHSPGYELSPRGKAYLETAGDSQ